jgi:hypothetical protein
VHAATMYAAWHGIPLKEWKHWKNGPPRVVIHVKRTT